MGKTAEETHGPVRKPVTLMEKVMKRALTTAVILALCLTGGAIAGTEENAEDFMQIHKVEIMFHEAGTTKNLDLMLSLADDATITAGGKTYHGKDQIRNFWQAAGTFQPQNQWVAYTPAFRIKYDVEGDNAHLISNASTSIRQQTRSSRTPTRTTPWSASMPGG